MIAAGTSPPRVTQTIACQLPCPDSRQASARASRWNWSQDTGNALSDRGSAIVLSLLKAPPDHLTAPGDHANSARPRSTGKIPRETGDQRPPIAPSIQSNTASAQTAAPRPPQ